jgi:hypothetical protein
MHGNSWSPASVVAAAAVSSIVILIVTGVLEVGAVNERTPKPVRSLVALGAAQVPVPEGYTQLVVAPAVVWTVTSIVPQMLDAESCIGQ